MYRKIENKQNNLNTIEFFNSIVRSDLKLCTFTLTLLLIGMFLFSTQRLEV